MFFLILIATVSTYGSTDSIFKELNYAMKHKSQYDKNKEKRISRLKKMLSGEMSLLQEYDCNKNLFSEYRKFKVDSAIYYVKKNKRIAEILKDKKLINLAQLQLANLFSSSGKYLECERILKGIDSKKLQKDILPLYYETYGQFLEHYSTSTYNGQFIKQISSYRDSLLSVLEPYSVKYKINLAQKNIEAGAVSIAQKELLQLASESRKRDQDFAMIAYLIGQTYKINGDAKLEREYYMLSAITDIENSIKDNASVQNLALIYYETGDIDNAYRFTKSAIEDAIFCNVKFRTLQISELYSIINTTYLDKESKRKEQLQLYLILISILSLLLIIAIVYVYHQMKKVSKIKEELHLNSQKLAELNSNIIQNNDLLNDRNNQLSESNRVKEEYIAHFFDMCSTYINKLENYRKSLNKKASEKQLEELFKMLKSTTVVDTELEELYKNFDSIFLNLYPTFVRDFNSLLIKDEQVILKQGELLNTELRIFALIRLGITDSVKIAAFLRYSLSTIYNYRTKTRNKAVVSRDEFEEMVSKIGIIPGKTF
ncbi:DUF6377 domain-containing protein [Flavobacterium qiangtangense]|uniref:DUF6377 domain-containing protein n=1 Tax=Flavobacterium qiangtangense TaxID=1442595 RepID=A0ABW1PHZ9_9FLAO